MTPQVKNLALDYPFFETYFLYLFSELGTRITICINPSTVSLTRRQKPTRNVVLGNIFKWLAVGRHNTKYVVNCRHFMRLRVLFVTPYHISRLLPPNSHLLSLVSYLPPLVSLSCLPQPLPSLVSCLSSPVCCLSISRLLSPTSLLSSNVSLLPSYHPPSPLYPSPLETPKEGGRGELNWHQEGGRWPPGQKRWGWPPAGVEDDSLGREGWKMAAGWGGGNLTASRG